VEDEPNRGSSLVGAGRNLLPVWSTVAIFVVIQVVDQLLSQQWGLLTRRNEIRRESLLVIATVSDVVFVVTLVAVVAGALLRTRARWMNRLVVAYLIVATVNLVVNVANMVLSAQFQQAEELRLLGDLALIYANTVLVFAVWYRLLDAVDDGRAFEFPADPGDPDRRLGWVDYLFLSFNTNATFGPTAEVPHARVAKLLMMVQTSLSLLILVVLVARIVGLGR
jgi:hypothetical protein